MPSRSNRFFAGMLTGYGTIAANVVFTMTSIPLALHYMDKEHFGLWALAVQINGYLSLIDLGMSGAVSRYVADHKDDVNGGKYGSHLLTGGMVFVIQGLIIAVAGVGFSWFAPTVFAIPAHLAGDFRLLLMLLACTAGGSVTLRSLGAPLWAFQRSDVINGCSAIGLFVTLALLWFGFRSGWGVLSFAIAQIPAVLGSLAVYAWVCHNNHYYPSAGHWGKPSVAIFKHIFHYGKDVLIVTIGSQLINATQIMIISRIIGLDAAATFSVATKFYTMAMLLVSNPISASAPGLTELHVRGEIERFVRRYWDLIAMTLTISTLAATCLAAGNRSLVSIWTHGAISWPWACDLLLALLIVLQNLNGCFVGLFGLTKDWRPVRYIYLAEGLVFVPIAILLAHHFGLVGVLSASLIAHLFVTTVLSARAAGHILGSWVHLGKGLATSLGLIGSASAFAWIGVHMKANSFAMLAMTSAITLIATAVAWYFIFPESMRIEVSAKIGIAANKLRNLFGRPA